MPQFKRLLRERIEAPDEAVPVVTPAVTLHPIVHAQKMRMARMSDLPQPSELPRGNDSFCRSLSSFL
jgi:hypothetical protein